MKTYFKIPIVFVTILVMCLVNHIYVNANAEEINFVGAGTENDPYLIQGKDDICNLRDLVNSGEKFQEKYFSQTCDIDLENEIWEPIGTGTKELSFYGIYDGKGYSIKNLYVENKKYAGLFGNLGGKVVNLKIESGNINGKISGALAGRSVGTNAVIANCINQANVQGDYAAGIAGNFYQGVIANCINLGNITGSNAFSIVAVNNDVKIYRTYSVNCEIAPEGIVPARSSVVSMEYLSSQGFLIKNSITAALSRWLFLGEENIKLLEWGNNGELFLKENGMISGLVYFFNFLFLPLLLGAVYVNLIIKYKRDGSNFYKKNKSLVNAIFIITIIVSYFCDVFVCVKGIKILHFGNALFLILVNLCWLLLAFVVWRNKSDFRFKVSVPLMCVIGLVVVSEMLQFHNIPRYDANIYYGSFVNSIRLFNLDFLSFIGAFNCWKWAQGIALFAAPLEALFPGQSVGVYLANIIISVVTLFLLHWTIKKIYSQITDFQTSMVCLIFAFSPYIVGLFSYMDMDWHIAFFVVWFIAAIIARNDWLIAFSGFLLSFTKITGFIFYVFFLMLYMIIEIGMNKKEGGIVKRFLAWWSWKKIIIWSLPVVSFLILFKYGDFLTSQSFFGTYVGDSMIKLFDVNQIMNTALQSFVFGFRWLLLILVIWGMIINIRKRELMLKKNKIIVYSLFISIILMFVMLALYNSDANCPRYTTIFSTLFALLLPLSFDIIKNTKIKNIITILIGGILVVQTFWTIDPSIRLYAKSINTGKKEIYKLTYTLDQRVGMNLASGAENQYPNMGDVYAYNLEYSYYDNLLDQAMKKMDFSKTKNVFILDIATYEINVNGRNYGGAEWYKIYWDDIKKKRVFSSRGTQFLNSQTIYSDYILQYGKDYLKDNDRFYLIVPARVQNENVIKKIGDLGYNVEKISTCDNIYGMITVYYVEE